MNPAAFWSAFERAGMLVDAIYQPAAGDPVTVKVKKKQPDQIIMDGAMQTTEYFIEYLSSQLTLARGSEIMVDGVRFSVCQTPMQDAEGWFTTVQLEPVE